MLDFDLHHKYLNTAINVFIKISITFISIIKKGPIEIK